MSRAKRVEELDSLLKAKGLRLSANEFMELVMQAVASSRTEHSGESLGELSAAEREALQRGGFDLRPRKRAGPGPQERTVAGFAAMLVEAFTVQEAAELLGATPREIRHQLVRRALYGIKSDRRWLLPRFQFHAGGPLPGLSTVLPVMDPTLHPMSVQGFFLTPQPDLIIPGEDRQLSPRDWLIRALPPGPVAAMARDMHTY